MSHWKVYDYMRGWKAARWADTNRGLERDHGPIPRPEFRGYDAGWNDYIKAQSEED